MPARSSLPERPHAACAVHARHCIVAVHHVELHQELSVLAAVEAHCVCFPATSSLLPQHAQMLEDDWHADGDIKHH